MIDPKKIFVCVVFHHSELRERGSEVIMDFCDSWRAHMFPYTLVILDNSSTIDYTEHLKGIDHHFIRVENEVANGGITGAWNQLCRYAGDNGAEIITGFADDVVLNPTFNDYITSITDDNTLYAPLTDGISGGPWQFQKSNTVKPNYTHSSDIVNGFWMGFTRKFYLDKVDNGELFPKNQIPEMDDWAGQEFIFPYWCRVYGTQCITIGDCWLKHTKLRSWKMAREVYK
jgi:GT2 family glycosyltransferase